jgi:hypothetical protein
MFPLNLSSPAMALKPNFSSTNYGSFFALLSQVITERVSKRLFAKEKSPNIEPPNQSN